MNNIQHWINGNNDGVPAVTASGWCGTPYLSEPGRTMRLTVHFSF